MWIAILPRGVSKPMIIQSGTNVNGEVNREMCLRGGLTPFIDEKDPEGGYLFCSVPAVTHYARDTVQFLEEAGVTTLKRDDNPPNMPQLRPTEDFWGVMKQEVYRGGWVGPLKQN